MKSINLKFLFVLLVSVAMVFSITACGGGAASDDDSGSDAAMTEAPVEATEYPADATEYPADATEAPAGDVVPAFKFTNTGSVEICELYLAPSGQEDWGPDQLQGQTIAAGAEFTLKNIPAGSYDAKAVGCNGGGEQTLQLDIHN